MSGEITRNPKLAWREVDGAMVIISPEDSQVHELNEIASLFWKHAEGKTLDQLVERISAEYEVARETGRLRLAHRDPADRFLLATAKVFELTLVTADEHLLKARDVSVLANR